MNAPSTTSSSSAHRPTRGRRRGYSTRPTRDWSTIRSAPPTISQPSRSASNDKSAGVDIATMRARNRSRFSNSPTSNATPSSNAPLASFVKPDSRTKPKPASYYEPRLRPGLIGTSRATGLSRVPDPYFIDSPTNIHAQLQTLHQRVTKLISLNQAVIPCDRITLHALVSDATLEAWEELLAHYRALTMAITASKSTEALLLAREVYEKAADTALFGGNLAFYLSCQSRLLRDIYPINATKSSSDARHAEFAGYALLYFGVFAPNRLELVQLMRKMTPYIARQKCVKDAFEVIQAYRHRDGFRYIEYYSRADVRQRTLMSPKMPRMRRHGMLQIIKAYLKLEKDVAHAYLGMKTEDEFVQLLKEVRPDLVHVNDQSGDIYRFRVVTR